MIEPAFPWGAFFLYCFVTGITPGPNNIMSMSLGLRIGFLKTLRFNAGVLLGFSCITSLAALFCTKLNEIVPQILFPMKIAGTLYLLWLSWKILRSTYSPKADEGASSASFLAGVFLQFANVKIMVSSIIVNQIFILPNVSSPFSIWFFALLLAFLGTSCNLVWSSAGSAAARLFSQYTKPINGVLAASLAACALYLWM